MHVHERSDIAERLAEVDRIAPYPRMPPASLSVRLKTTPWIRGLLPTSFVVRRAERRGRLLWDSSDWDREDSLGAMEALVGASPRAGELTELAKQHLVEREVDRALFWQPWGVPEIDPESLERLRGALDGPRPVLLAASHQGPYHRTSRRVLRMGYKPYVVAGEWYFDEPSHDYWGRRLARWRKSARVNLVRSKGSFPVLKALLERGEAVLLYYDMPGRRESTFLGKPATLADGISRLAVDTGALVLPVRMMREGHLTRLDIAEPLDGRAIADVDTLHRELGAIFERWILEFPPRMDDPRKFGWGDGARAAEWIAPDPRGAPAPSQSD
jgi:lauroyl/myristoyl acyltransferase